MHPDTGTLACPRPETSIHLPCDLRKRSRTGIDHYCETGAPALCHTRPTSSRSPTVTSAATLLPERLLVASALTLTAVLFLTNTSDPVNVPKLVVETTFAVLALAGLLARLIRHRVGFAPWGLGAIAALLLLVAFTVATVVAPHPGLAVHGAYGRNSGYLAYLAAIVLFLVVLAAFDAPAVRLLLFGLLAGGLFTATYGLFQR